jgi:hypothetical protein
MSIKSFTPLEEGRVVSAADINNTFEATNGLAGTIASINSEQIATEGITRRVCNTWTDSYSAGTPSTYGEGNPWLAYPQVTHKLTGNWIHQDTDTAYIETETGSGTDLELDLKIDNCTSGDYIVVEFVGMISVCHYLDKNFTAGSAVIVPSNYYDDFTEMWFARDMDSAGREALPTATVGAMKWSYGSLFAVGSGAMSTGNIYPTNAAQTYAGSTNAGPGHARPFHMSYIEPLDGTESTFSVKVAVNPGNYGSSAGAWADPAVQVWTGSTLSAYIVRKGG